MSDNPLRVGLIGCGNIADIYARNAPRFRDIALVACASRRHEAAQGFALRYGLVPRTVEDLITALDIDIVLNLTPPQAHAEITRAALRAGKHVYSEKPLGVSLAEAEALSQLAEAQGLRLGVAPDTFLGAGIQTAIAQLRAGALGQVLTGTATIMSRGMEHWHPNPQFFYQPGGGPVLDLGPYYLTALVALLGPVRSVWAAAQTSPTARICGPNTATPGARFTAEVPTTVNAVLSFEAGAVVQFMASWDVWRHSLPPFELHGTSASFKGTDPDTFGGVPEVSLPVLSTESGPKFRTLPTDDLIFGVLNDPAASPTKANYRGLGLAEMAAAIRTGQDHRCSSALALHVTATMFAILESGARGTSIPVGHMCAAPEPLTQFQAQELLL